MAAAGGYFDRKPPSAVRPGLSQLQLAGRGPSSPHTPQRVLSSTFSSPAASYRTEEDTLVFQFGERHFSAGFAGESSPRCTLSFSPEECRRIGDYRHWLPEYQERTGRKTQVERWGEDHELWEMDLRAVDLRLVEDRIERAVREAYSRYLLLDTKTRKLALVLPSVVPHPLLSTVLSTLFNKFQNPSITLLSEATMAAVAAGLRSGMIVDIGWQETIITSVCEYRETQHHRTTRAMKMITLQMARVLQAESRKHENHQADLTTSVEPGREVLDVDFEHAEEVTARMAWCRKAVPRDVSNEDFKNQCHDLDLKVSRPDNYADAKTPKEESVVSVALLSGSSPVVHLPFECFSWPVETALFADRTSPCHLDDHEQTLPYLLYKALLSLPPDLRGLCMSRIIIVGSGSKIPGLKLRLLDELYILVKHRGWDPVWGRAADENRRRKEIARSYRAAISKSQPIQKSSEDTSDPPKDSKPAVVAAFEPQAPDPIESKLHEDEAKGIKPICSGKIRGVETLGSWAGASLVAGMRIKGIAEIERDSFLQHGLAGAKRETHPSVLQSCQSFGPGIPRGSTEKVGWILGQWA